MQQQNNAGSKRTVDALAVLLLLAVEDGVLVLGQHLLLARHLGVPSLDGLGAHAVVLQGGAEGVDDLVDQLQSLALAGFLGCAEAPRSFPARRPWLVDCVRRVGV